MQTLIKRDGVHLPAGFEKDAYTLKVLNSAIQDELTQARSRIKKMVTLLHRHLIATATCH